MFQYVLLGREVHTDGTKLYHVLDCSDRSIDVLSESEMQTCMKMKIAISEVTCSGASFKVSDRVDYQVKGTKSLNYVGDCEAIYVTSIKPAVHIPHMRDMYRKDAFSYIEKGVKVILG